MTAANLLNRVARGRLSKYCDPRGLALVVIVSAGALLRLVLMARGNWLLDADEALVGLMANHILHGEHPIFVYGQPYSGALQAYLAAPLYAAFGMSRASAKVVTIPEYVAFAFSLYALARRTYDTTVALLATALIALPPVYVVSMMTRIWTPYVGAVAAGNVVLLLTINAVYGPPARRPGAASFALIGLVGGFGFWLHPVIVDYLATAALLILLRDHRAPLRPPVLAALPAAVIGALPVLDYARTHGTATLSLMLNSKEQFSSHRYLDVAHYYFSRVVPEIAGARTPWAASQPLLGVVVMFGTAGAVASLLIGRRRGLLGWARLSLREGEPRDALVLLMLVTSAAFIFSNFGRSGLRFYEDFHLETVGRYAMPLLSALPIVVAGEITRAWRRRRAIAVIAVAVIAASTVIGYLQSSPTDPWQSPYWRALPASNQQLIAALDGLGVDDAWMTLWAGRLVTFDTHERISTADYDSIFVGHSPDRLAEHTRRVLADPLPAFVFVRPNGHAELEDWLAAHQIPYQKRVVAPFVVLRPLRHVDPAEVAGYLAS